MHMGRETSGNTGQYRLHIILSLYSLVSIQPILEYCYHLTINSRDL